MPETALPLPRWTLSACVALALLGSVAVRIDRPDAVRPDAASPAACDDLPPAVPPGRQPDVQRGRPQRGAPAPKWIGAPKGDAPTMRRLPFDCPPARRGERRAAFGGARG